MTLSELIAALERAEGPSRELDFWCWWRSTPVLHGQEPDPNDAAEDIRRDILPRYTSSIDAALTLLEEGETWCLFGWGGAEAGTTFARAATPALALCIAALKARGEG